MRWLLLLLFATFNALADLPTMEDPRAARARALWRRCKTTVLTSWCC